MKPPTVFLGEMTTLEVDAFLAGHDTVIVPVGSTEQHGPHGPLLTDALIPVEVARRVAPRVGAVVAPVRQLLAVIPARWLHRRGARADPHLHGTHRGPVPVAGGDRVPADRVPQRPLRQHLRHRVCLRQRRGPSARRHLRVPGQLLGRHDAGRGGRVLRPVQRTPRQQGRDVGRPGHRARAGGHGVGQRRVPTVPERDQPRPRPHGVLLRRPGLRPPGHPVRYLG